MKNHYDKLLFVLAVVVLAAAAGFVVTRPKDGPADLPTLTGASPTGQSFATPTFVPPTFNNAQWPAAIDQGPEKDGLWVYGVFTPPKIWWNEQEKQFEATPPVPPMVRPPFGIEFVEVKRMPYRLQLTGSSELPDGGIRLIFAEDGAATPLRALKGETVQGESLKFEILDAQSVRQVQEDGSINRRTVVKIKDLSNDKILELNDKERLYMDSEREIVVRAIREPDQVWTFKQAGGSFQYGEGTFTIREINFDTPAIKVEKVLPGFKENEVVTLLPADTQPPESENNSTDSPSQAPASVSPADLFN